MADAYVLTQRAIDQLRRDHQTLKNDVRHLRSLASEADTPADWGRVLRTGITAVGPDLAPYPTSGNTFWVAIEAWTFTETTGKQDVTYDKYEEYVIARTEDGTYLPKGTHVVLYRQQSRIGRRWWIRRVPSDSSTSSSSTSDSSSSTSSLTSSSSSVSSSPSSSVSSSSSTSSGSSSSSSSSSSTSSLSSPSSSSLSSSSLTSISSSSLSTGSSSSSCPSTCHEVEVVTDVACVNGNIVVTKKKLRICGDNLCVDLV